MKNKKSNIINLLILILLVGLTFYVIFKNNEISSIVDVIRSVNIWYILLGILMMIVFFVSGAYGLKVILDSFKIKTSLWKCLKYVNIDYYFASITPSATGGQPAEVYYMNKDKISPLTSTMALLLIAAAYKAVIVILGILAIFLIPTLLIGNGILFDITFPLGIVVNIFIIGICIGLIFSPQTIKKIAVKGIKIFNKIKIVKNKEKTLEKLDKQLIEYEKGMKYIKENKLISLKVFLWAFVQRLSVFLVSYFVYRSFGFASWNVLTFVLLQVALTLAVDCFPMPGGVGASEILFLHIYSKIYSAKFLTPAMLLTRGINYYLCLIVSAIVTIYVYVKYSALKTHENKM